MTVECPPSPEPTLYLATFDREKVEYMSETGRKPKPMIRLVRAHGLIDAELKLKAEVERFDPYGTSYYVHNLDITACIE
jgi:hypothetical protein